MIEARVLGGAEVTAAEDASFGAFFAAHYQGALRLAALLTGDRMRAEDAVCDAFAKVYARWRRGGIDDIDVYLRQAVVNTLRSRWRRRSLEQSKAPAVQTAAWLAHDDGRFEQRVADRDAIWRALDGLSEAQRRVVVLRYYEDLSEAAVAQMLGLSVGTVKSQAARGLARLETILAGLREAEGA